MIWLEIECDGPDCGSKGRARFVRIDGEGDLDYEAPLGWSWAPYGGGVRCPICTQGKGVMDVLSRIREVTGCNASVARTAFVSCGGDAEVAIRAVNKAGWTSGSKS